MSRRPIPIRLASNLANLQPVAAQNPTDTELDVEQLALQQLAGDEQRMSIQAPLQVPSGFAVLPKHWSAHSPGSPATAAHQGLGADTGRHRDMNLHRDEAPHAEKDRGCRGSDYLGALYPL